jgi:hypothetical protein
MPGSPFFTIPAPATSNVKRHGNQVTHFDEFYISARLDDLSGNFVA